MLNNLFSNQVVSEMLSFVSLLGILFNQRLQKAENFFFVNRLAVKPVESLTIEAASQIHIIHAGC